MSSHLMVALVEDSKGQTFQFNAFTDDDLNAKIAAWVRPRWREDFGTCPEEDADCLEVYFENMAGPPFAFPGFEHTLKVIETIKIPEVEEVAALRRWKAEALQVMPDFQAIGKELGLGIGTDVSAQILPAIRALKQPAIGQHSPGPWSQDPEGEVARTIEDRDGNPICDVYLTGDGITPEIAQANVDLIEAAPTLLGFRPELSRVAGNACYPMELYVNGELSFKLDSEDATGDLSAIKALMQFRTARRQNRPLTNMELYGTAFPDEVVHTTADGKKFYVQKDGSLREPGVEQS